MWIVIGHNYIWNLNVLCNLEQIKETQTKKECKREGTMTERKKRRVKETPKRRVGWTKERNETECAFETVKP
jgi:hypothetical protein